MSSVPEVSKALRETIKFLDYADEVLTIMAESQGRDLGLDNEIQQDLESLAAWFEKHPEIAEKASETLKHWNQNNG